MQPSRFNAAISVLLDHRHHNDELYTGPSSCTPHRAARYLKCSCTGQEERQAGSTMSTIDKNKHQPIGGQAGAAADGC